MQQNRGIETTWGGGVEAGVLAGRECCAPDVFGDKAGTKSGGGRLLHVVERCSKKEKEGEKRIVVRYITAHRRVLIRYITGHHPAWFQHNGARYAIA